MDFKIPENINICGLDYEVQKVDTVNKMIPRAGEIDFLEQVIKIDSTAKEDRQTVVFIHECLHGICEGLGLELEGELEERIIKGCSTELYKIIKQL